MSRAIDIFIYLFVLAVLVVVPFKNKDSEELLPSKTIYTNRNVDSLQTWKDSMEVKYKALKIEIDKLNKEVFIGCKKSDCPKVDKRYE